MKNLLKKGILKKGAILAIVFSFIAIGSGCNLVQMTPEADKKQVVVEVGKEKYTKQEFDSYFALYEMLYTASGQPFPTEEEQLNTVKEQYLEAFASEQLAIQLGKTEKVKVEDKDPKEEIENFKKSFQEALGGEEEYNKTLENNNLTPEEFEEYLKKFLQDGRYGEALRQKVIKDVSISDKEVKKYYEENHQQVVDTVKAKHILADTEHKKLAEEIAQKAKDGEDFDALIKEYKEKEGVSEAAELPEFYYPQMVPEFSEAAFALEPGQVSDIVESQFGFHVIKVEEKNQPTFEEVKESLNAQLLQDKQQQAYQDYLNEKMQDIEIKTYPEKL